MTFSDEHAAKMAVRSKMTRSGACPGLPFGGQDLYVSGVEYSSTGQEEERTKLSRRRTFRAAHLLGATVLPYAREILWYPVET
jgi:hypothetical protein